MSEKKYYWLKLQNDFFTSLRIKKLRKLAGGDTFTIIYLKMQLLSLKTNGVLEYKGIESSFAEEMALELDEDIDNIQVTIQYLLSCGLLIESDNQYEMPYVKENTQSETKWAEKKRIQRAKKDEERTIEGHCPREIEKDIDKEKDIDIEIDKDNIGAKSKRFVPPTVEEVTEYCNERNNNVNPQAFIDFYESKGWMVGKNKMKDWKAAVRTWENSRKTTKSSNPSNSGLGVDKDEWLRMWGANND